MTASQSVVEGWSSIPGRGRGVSMVEKAREDRGEATFENKELVLEWRLRSAAGEEEGLERRRRRETGRFLHTNQKVLDEVSSQQPQRSSPVDEARNVHDCCRYWHFKRLKHSIPVHTEPHLAAATCVSTIHCAANAQGGTTESSSCSISSV
eukprot:3940675-Rhodomonas_salina.1